MIIREARSVISEKEAGLRLDYWLAKRFTYNSRKQWQDKIRKGRILINDTPVYKSKKLVARDLVEYKMLMAKEPQVSLEVDKVYEDDDLIIINKPGNLPCHPAGTFFKNTLWYILKKDYENFWIINRLDRETSGLVLLAKTKASARHLAKQFATGTIRKRYLVLVEGQFPARARLKGYLVPDSKSQIKKQVMVVKNPVKSGKFVHTNVITLERRSNYSLLVVIPKTGKLHQIRATLYSERFPIVGDKIYGPIPNAYLRFIKGNLDNSDKDRLGMERQALHAYRLRFVHPSSRSSMTFTAPIPNDLKRALSTIGFQNYNYTLSRFKSLD